MKILAIDTATERCSVALSDDGIIEERATDTQRGHAELILPMIAAVLEAGGLGLRDLDAVAYGRGPGAFTGVRIAVGVVQGLAYGARLPTVGVSDLAALAQQATRLGEEALVCMDARMGEVYWARFVMDPNGGFVRPLSEERVGPPASVSAGGASVFIGAWFKAHPQLAALRPARLHDEMLPRAREIALLAQPEVRAGRGQPADRATPVYLRDKVVGK